MVTFKRAMTHEEARGQWERLMAQQAQQAQREAERAHRHWQRNQRLMAQREARGGCAPSDVVPLVVLVVLGLLALGVLH